MFLPEDKAETKRYWTEFAENTPLNFCEKLANQGPGQPLTPRILWLLLIGTVIVPICCLIKYCIGQYKANQCEVYNDLSTWQEKRQSAKEMGFKELIQTFGAARVRRYLLLSDTPEENLALYKQKFQEFLKSDEVVARQWAVQGRDTPWEDFISLPQLKEENLVEGYHYDTQCKNLLEKIPENKKRKGEIGAQIQNLNFEEFQQEFSQDQLKREGVLERSNWHNSVYPELQRILKASIPE